ncbi:MAG: 1-acyl-sn-glycerol-3-phosphate acyltransferase [Oscillospiraceae bacterium]|nr:1-acyl-sn-glycerol-3-phosphate acyltransferase [Oscillospiraceae bacterium]
MLLGTMAVVSCGVGVLTCVLSDSFDSLAWLWVLPATFIGSFLLLALLAFLFVWFVCSRVDTSREQTEDDPFFRRLTGLYIEALIPVLGVRVHTAGLEKVPVSGRFMLVCNHLHMADPAVLLHVFRKHQLAFISKKENNDMFLVGKLLHKLLCQPIDRENDREALKTILKCIRILQEDKASVAVFPEGYTSRDHKLHHFRSGVFKIAQKAKVPVVVCTMTNTHNFMKNLTRLKSTHVDLHVVQVIQPEEFAGMTTVALGERIYELMAADLGAEYAENT